MSSVTIDEVRSSLPELLQRVRVEPVFIRDADGEVAVLVSRRDFDLDRRMKIEAFERSRDAMAAELEKNLARDGITVEEFVKDLLA
jgi:antitoxin (DNA-binding transcriptional repressor) of toxin-antitoxin stability system